MCIELKFLIYLNSNANVMYMSYKFLVLVIFFLIHKGIKKNRMTPGQKIYCSVFKLFYIFIYGIIFPLITAVL